MITHAQPVTLDECTVNGLPTVDYPAAHSMDTEWFAVDENGEIGAFDTGEGGRAPLLEGMDPPSIEDRLKSEYSKAYDYANQYHGVGNFAGGRSHCYASQDMDDSLYYWQSSPGKPLKLENLPEHLRNGRHLLQLKDYDFRSREPLDLYEYVRLCYAEWASYPDLFPAGDEQTPFPVLDADGGWSMKSFDNCQERVGLFCGKAFFAIDDDGCLALFRTDRFGGMPLEKSGGSPMARSRADHHRADMKTWKEFVESDPLSLAKARQAWREHGPAHWLEYPFGEASPRLFGVYHYDASWHYPLPYLRIGRPTEPVKFDQCSIQWRERIKPVHLAGVHFARDGRVQPFEYTPCIAVSEDSYDESNGWKYPQVWIDSSLEKVYPMHEFSVFTGSSELLLRRARRHVRRVESLARA